MMEKATMQLVSEQLKGPYVNIVYRVQWLMPDGTVRRQEESTEEFFYPGIFTAAGRTYQSWQQLCAEELDEQGHICRDIYGREVFAEWERFPCFDSYDYLYENRYYRWFFIREGDRLTCVSYTDQSKTITVTEDIRKLRERCWKAMKAHSWQGC